MTDQLGKLSLIAVAYGIFEGVSHYLQGFKRSSLILAFISVFFGFFIYLLKLLNETLVCRDILGLSSKQPKLRVLFQAIKEYTGPIVRLSVSIVTTEKLIYKFPDTFSLHPE